MQQAKYSIGTAIFTCTFFYNVILRNFLSIRSMTRVFDKLKRFKFSMCTKSKMLLLFDIVVLTIEKALRLKTQLQVLFQQYWVRTVLLLDKEWVLKKKKYQYWWHFVTKCTWEDKWGSENEDEKNRIQYIIRKWAHHYIEKCNFNANEGGQSPKLLNHMKFSSFNE